MTAKAPFSGVKLGVQDDLIENGLICALMHACCLTLIEQCQTDQRMSPAQLLNALEHIEQYRPKSTLPEKLRLAYVDTACAYARCTVDHRLLRRVSEQFPEEFTKIEAASADLH